MKNKQHLPISGHIFALRENKKCFSVSFVCCNWIVLELIVVVNFCLVWCFNFISRFHPRDSMHRIYWTGLFTLRAWKRSFMLVEKQLFLGVEKNNRSSNASCIFIIIFFLLAKNNKIDTSSFKMFFLLLNLDYLREYFSQYLEYRHRKDFYHISDLKTLPMPFFLKSNHAT